MTVDITANNGHSMDVPNVAWAFIIEFATRFGWQPVGTLPPSWYDEPEPWNGSYDPAMGQYVSAEDAASLGAAIKRGLESERLDRVLAEVEMALNDELRRAGYADAPTGRVTKETIAMLRGFSDLALKSDGICIE